MFNCSSYPLHSLSSDLQASTLVRRLLMSPSHAHLSSRHRCDLRRHHPVRGSPLGPPPPHRQMGQPRRRVLCVLLLHPCHPRHEHLRELAQRGQRHDRPLPQLHQHQARAGDLRDHRWVGAVSLGNPRERAWVLELHEWVHGVLGAIRRNVSSILPAFRIHICIRTIYLTLPLIYSLFIAWS